ncbi:MAG TPA: hypothetical protein H9926_06415, partial [Candidatus Eisenbergiella intestinigallinarum]|nr:hypothetical protein [Candidatus Eisenbergiella intestinigallinarum]
SLPPLPNSRLTVITFVILPLFLPPSAAFEMLSVFQRFLEAECLRIPACRHAVCTAACQHFETKNPACGILPAIEDCLRGGSRKRHLPYRRSAIHRRFLYDRK